MATLTKRQKQIYDYIKNYIEIKGISPTFDEIRKRFKLSALSTIHQHIEALIDKGFLIKNNKLTRGIELRKEDEFIKIPLVGSIAAGQPIETIEDREESIAISKNKLPRSGEFFALKVMGDSMIDENINDGDIVLIKKQCFASNGEKIVALIDNREATLKSFYKERSQIRLQPANKKLKPIIIKSDEKEIIIQGVVIDIIKNINPEKRIEKEKEKKLKIKRKNKLPLNKIILGDTLKELKKLPSGSCDIIIADPPYNIGKNFGNNIDKRELNEYIEWSKKWTNECIRLMKPTATMFIYGFSEILAHISVEISINKRWVIWHYTNKNVASLNFWQRSHESIICAWKDKRIFNRDEIREPYTLGFLNGAAGKIRKGTKGRFSTSGKTTIYKAHEKGALPRDVIKIPALAGGAGMNERWFLCKTCDEVFGPRKLKEHKDHKIIKHPTQKPLELSKKIIKSCMPKKYGVVLVPFVGSGSECVAAKELGQNYVGFEINPEYIKIAQKFLSNTKFKQKLF